MDCDGLVRDTAGDETHNGRILDHRFRALVVLGDHVLLPRIPVDLVAVAVLRVIDSCVSAGVDRKHRSGCAVVEELWEGFGAVL